MNKPLPNENEFMAELIPLAKKYGIVVAACGCCGSPWLGPISWASDDGNTIPSAKELGTVAGEEPVDEFRMKP